ncbi:hypothetical protein Droror1_Dr00007596 [Drosera rotundifolia]
MKRSCLNDDELGLLNKDIAIDILSRLPMKTLFGVRCVSKGWEQLISDPIFVAAYMKRTEPISGLFTQERSCMPSPSPGIYICNPLIKDFVRVMWSAPNKKDCIALVFDPVSPHTVKTTSLYFKLVMVRIVEDFATDDAYYSFHIYSSQSRTWMKSKEICHCEYNLVNNSATCAGGILYWMTEGHQVLMFDVENELSCLISLPLPTTKETIPDKCIGESGRKLHCVTISQDGVLVWVLIENFDSQWTLTWSIPLKKMEEENKQYLYNLAARVELQTIDEFSPYMMALAFKDGLLVLTISFNLFFYDIQKKKLEKLCSMDELGKKSIMNPTVLPFSLSLVPVSRL